MMLSFDDVCNLLLDKGPGSAISSKNINYTILARNGNILALPKSGRITLHEDCWGKNITCQGTRAGGIYNGPYSIYDWCRDNM